MRYRSLFVPFALVAILSFVSPQAAHARDLDYERLAESLDRLASDPKLGGLAPAQMDRARASLQALKDAGRRDRPHFVYITERRIDIARTTAQAELIENERTALQRENDQLQLAAARRDADQARRELEQQRLQSQIRAEESERLARDAEAARAEGEQASQAAEAARAESAQAKRMADAQAKAAALAKKEAELAGGGTPAAPAAAVAPRRRMVLPESVFVTGQSALSDAGASRIAGVVDFINATPGSRVRIEAGAGGNRALATQRADAIRDAVVAAGVAAGRIQATGSGRGRQVEIRLDAAE